VSPFERPKEIGERPGPGELDLKWTYLNWTKSYYFDMWRSEGLDTLNFTDPRMNPQPRELEGGSLDMILTRQRMVELRDTLTYLIDNWGQPWARESHPEQPE
jgi:hypothetical protein